MLRVSDVHVGYGAIRALKGVSLEVNAGEVVALIGANGAGKSTLMSMLSGLLQPDEGEIRIRGKTVRFRSPRDQRLCPISANPWRHGEA